MPAIELRQDEIGFYDPEAAKARRERMFGKTKPVVLSLPPRAASVGSGPVVPQSPRRRAPLVLFAEPRNAAFDVARAYPVPIGPCRPGMEPRGEKIQIRAIIRIVAHVYGISVSDILSQRRMAEMVRPRQEAMWLCRKYTMHTLPQIGRQFAGRDHTTVLHAIRKIEQGMARGAYTPRADAWVADWRAYLGERDALSPKASGAEPIKPPPMRVRPMPARELPPIPTEMPKGVPPLVSSGAMWTVEERERVTFLLASGWSFDAVAVHLGRSLNALEKTIATYGLAPAIAAE